MIHADPEDAPEHLTHKRKPICVTPLLLALIAIGAFLYLAKKNDWLTHLNTQSIQLNTSHTPIRPKAPHLSPSPMGDVEKPAPRQNAKQTQRAPRAKQTVFNDQNYRPKTNINIIKPPAKQHLASKDRLTRPIGLNGSGHTRLIWETTWWQGTYRFSKSIIKYDDFCRSETYPRKGSIEYRACRKAAKSYLRDECRAGRSKSREVRRMYCHAVDAFRH